MVRNSFRWLLGSLLIAGAMTQTGCVTNQGGPFLGWVSIPVPVSPYWQKLPEDKHHWHERYERVPILGPLTAGGPVEALDPPSDDEVYRALERSDTVQGGIPFLWERQRNNYQIVKEKIADYVDPPRVYPLLGPAQLHHAHYKCTVYYSEKTRVGWPIPHTLEDEDSRQVIYIDHNHLHMVGNVDGGPGHYAGPVQ
jgi:hypothetical protein